MENNKNINEVCINGSRVFIEDGEVKTVLSETVQKTGYMSVDEMFNLIEQEIKMIYNMNDGV